MQYTISSWWYLSFSKHAMPLHNTLVIKNDLWTSKDKLIGTFAWDDPNIFERVRELNHAANTALNGQSRHQETDKAQRFGLVQISNA